ncbi:MAG: response regulator [Treponema sp.]|nr:response regulator [Treponema sp.]
MNNNDSFRLSVIKPTQIAVVVYAIVKQIFVTFFVEGDYWIYRFLISIVWLSIIFIVTNSKKLTRRQIAILVLTTTVIQEIVFFVAFGGDRMIFFFLLGCSLMSIMYADKLVMLITMFLSCIAISFCIFVLGIKSTVGVEYELIYDVFNIAGLIMINTVIYLIGKYTIGTLANARQEAEDASKAKSSFLATMSHEIRTPMNAITGIAQIQLQKNNLPEEYAQALEKIHRSSHSLLGIINDILDLSKIETGRMEITPVEYDVPSFIHDTVQLNMVRIGSKPIEIILDIDEKLPSKLIGDELRLKQILNNLLSNAIKYTEKGQVKLSVSHSANEKDVILRFTVEDTGQGMKSEDCGKLFSEYTRFNIDSNRATEGTGIGLNITKNLVELMEGTIKAESEYGVGSRFTVTIRQQAVECEAIGAELAQQMRSFTLSREKQHAGLQILREPMPYGKVLIVDDVETNLYVAEGLMSAYDLQIETAISGFAAIEKVERGSTYDVIFMDHMMPQMDGIETTQKLRVMGYRGTIVALTANALAGNADMFKQNGFDDFISKPIDLRNLNSILNKFVRDSHSPKNHLREKKQTMETIFIVDDNDTNLMAAKTALDGIYKTYALPSAAKMFKLAEKILPDLILLDIDMPEMDGFQAIQVLRSDNKLKSIPVIFLTAKEDEATEKQGLEMGALDFIRKPFSQPVLIERIEKYIRGQP